MARVEEIVGAYRKAGPPERMDTYLGHPALRGRFDEIEREELRGSPSGEAGREKGRLGRPCCPLAGRWRRGRT